MYAIGTKVRIKASVINHFTKLPPEVLGKVGTIVDNRTSKTWTPFDYLVAFTSNDAKLFFEDELEAIQQQLFLFEI